mgnify:CR=1 FL=1
MAAQLSNILFSKPISIGNKTVDDELPSGSYIVSGVNTNGLTNWSGLLLVESLSDIRLLISRDTLAFKRNDGNWYKVTAVEQV